MAPRISPHDDMNLLTNSLGPTEGAILTVLAVVVVICCVLYIGRRQEKMELKAKSDSQGNKPGAKKNWTVRSGFGDRPTDDHNHEDFENAGIAPVSEDATVEQAPTNDSHRNDWTVADLAPHQRPGWTEAVREVSRLVNIDCQRLLNTHKYAELKEASTRALQLCLTKLAPDHFLTGVCLDWLAYAEHGSGSHYDALLHLEAAASILSEWKAYDAHCKDNIRPRIAGCRQMLGFDPEG